MSTDKIIQSKIGELVLAGKDPKFLMENKDLVKELMEKYCVEIGKETAVIYKGSHTYDPDPNNLF